MAYTLKNATIPNKIRWIIAVDPADGAVKHYAPTDSTSRAGYAVTQGANVTIGAQAWNGNTRSYFVNGTGTADADFVKFDTNKPSYNPGNTGEAYTLLWCGENVSSGQPLCAFGYDSTHYMATFDMGAGGNTYPCLVRNGTVLNPGQAYPGANQKLLFGFHLTMNTSLYALYGSDSGAPTKSSSLGAPGNATSTDLDLNYVSRRNDSPNDHPFKTHFVLQTDSILSDAEVDALRVDWFTELFETTSDTTAPTLTSPTGTGGTLTASGSVSTNEGNGTLWWKLDAAGTAADPGAGNEPGAGWLSQAVSSSGVQSIASFGAVAAGTWVANYIHVDSAGNRSTVARSSSFGVVPPTPTTATTSNVTSTGATIGASTTATTGTRYVVVTPSATPPALNGNGTGFVVDSYAYSTSATINAAGAFTYLASGLTQGGTYYHHHVIGAGGQDSGVLTSPAFYPDTGRPISDVSAVGWTASSGGVMAAMLDEDSPGSDSDYISSPSLSGTPSEVIMELDKTFPAGTYDIKVRARVNIGTGNLVVRMLNGSNVSQGASATQALTTTATTYTLPITTSGDSTRISVEVTT